jgi:hypothetical protein
MTLERNIEALIKAGWNVLATDFDEKAFGQWRVEALNCLTALCGSEHVYTERFRNKVAEARSPIVPAGMDLPAAAGMHEAHQAASYTQEGRMNE